jgi:hypothetical protein
MVQPYFFKGLRDLHGARRTKRKRSTSRPMSYPAPLLKPVFCSAAPQHPNAKNRDLPENSEYLDIPEYLRNAL